MIFRWLHEGLLWLVKLLIPAPRETALPSIDPNEYCFSCGNRQGSIKAIEMGGKPYVQHSCRVCSAKWLVKPVTNAEKFLTIDPETQR